MASQKETSWVISQTEITPPIYTYFASGSWLETILFFSSWERYFLELEKLREISNLLLLRILGNLFTASQRYLWVVFMWHSRNTQEERRARGAKMMKDWLEREWGLRYCNLSLKNELDIQIPELCSIWKVI